MSGRNYGSKWRERNRFSRIDRNCPHLCESVYDVYLPNDTSCGGGICVISWGFKRIGAHTPITSLRLRAQIISSFLDF